MSRDYSVEARIDSVRAELSGINQWAERLFNAQVETNGLLEAILEELREAKSRNSSDAAAKTWRDDF